MKINLRKNKNKEDTVVLEEDENEKKEVEKMKKENSEMIKMDEYGHLHINRPKKLAALIATLLLALVLLLTTIVSIPTGHTGVVATFGRVENITLDSGIHFKLPWQKVIKMDNRVQKETVALSCFSRDIQETSMRFTINYQISSKDAMTIYSTIGKKYFDVVVLPSITEAVKTVTAKYTAEELINNRSELAKGIETDLSNSLKQYNILVVSTSVEDIDFTDAFTNAVEAKQVAQQNKIKAETEAETKLVNANADAEAKRIEADATAYVNETITESLNDKILEKMYYEKWDGKLPEVVGSESTVIMPRN